MPETIQKILKNSIEKLSKTSPSPRLDLELLLSHAIQKPREFVLAHPEKEINATQVSKIDKLIKRRLKHEPMAYILGKKEFYGLNFKVTPDTLIPRPETEHLVDTVISNLQLTTSKNKKTTIIDIGTGSGNIIISIAKNLNSLCHSRENGNPVANQKVSTLDSRIRGNDNIFYGIDISKKALCVAKYNAKKNKIEEKIKFLHGNLLEPIIGNWKLEIGNSKMIILANLPYVSKKIYSTVSPDIKNFEPKSALYSDNNGLDHYEKLFQQLHKLEIGNWKLEIFLEFSPEQKSQLQKLIKKYFSKTKVDFSKDLAGKWRVVSFTI